MPVRFVPSTSAPTHLGAFRRAITPASPEPPGVPFLPTFIGGYTFGVQIGFGVDNTADPSTWPLVDVSTDVQQAPGITIVRGRLDEQSTTMPAECRLQLDNRSGNYSTRRPQSTHYPNVRVGMPLRAYVATATGTYERFSGFVDEWDLGWDTTGNYAIVDVVAHGTLQRLGANSDTLRSTVYSTMAGRSPIAYWPLEDASGSTSAASAVNGPAMVQLGDITYSDAAPAGSAALPDFSSKGQLVGKVFGADTSSFEIDCVFRIDETTVGGYVGLLEIYASDSRYSLLYDTGFNQLVIFALPSASYNSLVHTVPADGSWHSVQVVLTQSGSNVQLHYYVDGVDPGSSYLLTGTTLGKLSTMKVPARGTLDVSSSALPVISTKAHIGHVAAYSPASFPPMNQVQLYSAVSGYSGEEATARMVRLCDEEGVPFVLSGTPGGRTMGPQTTSSLYTLLRECEAAGGGVLEDGVNFGLRYSELESRYNQTATMTPALTQLEPPLAPVESNQRIRNDVTASRPTGSSARYQQPAGLPYAVTGAGGISSVTFPMGLNVDTDGVLYPHASWEVAKGTVDADRYTQLKVNLAARTALIPQWLACVNGSRWTVPATYSTGGLPPDVLLEGWTEALSTFVWAVQANCSPALCYNLGIVDSSTAGRVGASDTTLAADIDAAVGSFTVNYTYAWSAAGGDYPFDIYIGGEQMTLTSVAGTTFNVTRGTGYGGYTSVHHAGDSVTLVRPAVAAL